MSRALPPDQEARDRALDPSLSVHVEAPAGSGKTTVLMMRFLAVLARVRAPEEVLALTFTRKAAGELRTRVQEEFQAREGSGHHSGGLDNESAHAARVQELARQAFFRHVDTAGAQLLERLQIATFHSFCAQLLRLAPQAAALAPDFGLLEDHQARQLRQEAVERLRRRLAALPSGDPVRQALVQRLVRLNNSWPRLAGELKSLLARRDILGEFLTLARQSRDPAAYEAVLLGQLESRLGPGLVGLAQEFREAEIGRQWPELCRYLADARSPLAATLPEGVPGAKLADLPAWRAVAQALLTTDGRCYKSFAKKFPAQFKKTPWGELLQNLPASLVQRLQSCQKIPAILLQPDEVPAIQDLIILLSAALTEYDNLCASRRCLDFIGLEEKALVLLEGGAGPELLGRLDRRLAHLLVDEFQDTSFTQIRLLCLLLDAWQGEAGRSLMVVGDPKQSIYGWRQARVEFFLQSRRDRRLPCPQAPPFQVLTLETNFRSSQTLIEWANAVFGQTVMAAVESCGVEFHGASPRPDPETGRPPQLALFAGADTREARRWEAAWLARELCHRQAQLAPGQSVGVLLFTRTHLPRYLEAWRQAGLSVRVKDGLPLKDSLAVQQVHNLARVLVRPHDNLAWAGLLRGLAGPQPLGVLADVAAAPGEFWQEKIRAYAASAGGAPLVQRLWKSLQAARRRVGREPLQNILVDCLDRLEGWCQVAAWEGAPGVANVRAYLDLLAQAAGATPEATFTGVEDLLAQAYQPPDPRAQDSPVEVLTVHGAKGLEYDYVYVPFLDWEPLMTNRQEEPFLLEEMPGTGTATIALNRAYAQEEQSVLYQTLKKTAQHSALGEARRLFYVAVTRAKKGLYLSGVAKRKTQSEMTFSGNSPLGWLRQHYQEGDLSPGAINLWQSPPLQVSVFEEAPDLLAPGAAAAFPQTRSEGLPAPYEIQPEPWPYEIQRPSQLAGETEKAEAASGAEDGAAGPMARLRGEISHRLLEGLSLGRPLPEAAVLAPALAGVVAGKGAALDLADEILAEVRACQADPFLAAILRPDLPLAKSEWLVESWHGPKTLYRGQIDRLVFDGRDYWLVDYKTSRPPAGVDWEEFLDWQKETYRPQLLAYREMAARYLGVDPPDMIHTVLYFTACQRYVLL